MKLLKKVAGGLVLVGALNWGAVGLFQIDLVSRLLGDMTMASRLVYLLVGISAVVLLLSKCRCKGCGECKGCNTSNCCQKN
jgi:hypothetical protein